MGSRTRKEPRPGINRTKLELKEEKAILDLIGLAGINRTKLELKVGLGVLFKGMV